MKEYNILQNNGKLAHQVGFLCFKPAQTLMRSQVVPHVHFHVIPKTSNEDGLQIGWPTKEADKEELKKYCEEM